MLEQLREHLLTLGSRCMVRHAFRVPKGSIIIATAIKRAWRSKTSQLALERRFVKRACAVEEVTEAQSFEARGPFVSWVLVLNTLYKQLYRLAYVSPEII